MTSSYVSYPLNEMSEHNAKVTERVANARCVERNMCLDFYAEIFADFFHSHLHLKLMEEFHVSIFIVSFFSQFLEKGELGMVIHVILNTTCEWEMKFSRKIKWKQQQQKVSHGNCCYVLFCRFTLVRCSFFICCIGIFNFTLPTKNNSYLCYVEWKRWKRPSYTATQKKT